MMNYHYNDLTLTGWLSLVVDGMFGRMPWRSVTLIYLNLHHRIYHDANNSSSMHKSQSSFAPTRSASGRDFFAHVSQQSGLLSSTGDGAFLG